MTLKLKTALASYGHTAPLINGDVGSAMLALECVEVSPITTAFRRMVPTPMGTEGDGWENREGP